MRNKRRWPAITKCLTLPWWEGARLRSSRPPAPCLAAAQYTGRISPMCDSHHHHEAATTATPAGSDVTFHVSDMTCGHCAGVIRSALEERSEEHTSELQSLMRISYAVFCLK